MIRTKVKITASDISTTIAYKRHTDVSQLSLCESVEYCGDIISETINTVKVPHAMYCRLRGTDIILYNRDNGLYVNIELAPDKLQNDQIKLTKYIKDTIEFDEGDKLALLANKTLTFSRIIIQRIDNIKEDYVTISNKDACGLSVALDKFTFFKLYNFYTGETIIVKRNHIKINNDLPQGAIQLNRKQRTFLGLELPRYIEPRLRDELMNKITDSNKLNLLMNCYTENDMFLKDDLTHEAKIQAKSIFNEYCKPHVCFVPIIESFHQHNFQGIKALTDFFVGKSTISLLSRRPYDSDEGSDIVRMSLSNMNLLGVNEMDKVIIKYKGNSVKCRVLELQDENAFYETNVKTNINYAIGIPAHIRKKLGLCNIKSAVKVDRDTGFIFKKSINEQIVPIILTLFSINIFQDPSVLLKTLLSVLAVPIVVYLNLSSKRNMRR